MTVIDLHCHVLAGIDDGPETVAGSLELARAAASAGTSTLVATPHVNWRYPNDADTIAAAVDELRGRLAAENVDLELRAGAEIAVTRLAEIEPEQLARLRLGGGEWLLVEPPFTPVAPGLEQTLQDLQQDGHRILLAHPERCPALHRDPQIVSSLVRGGVLTSITAGSLVGRFGGAPQRFALELVREELVHNVASDAHDVAGRAPGVSAELEQAGLTPLAEWLTMAVPAAILNGDAIPARPRLVRAPAIPARRWRLRRAAG
jgi:protein-tyrosine phosphatase